MSIDVYLERVAIPEPNSGCWIWMGKIGKNGYPSGNAHRRAYRLAGGILKKGMCLDHLCRVPCCINPNHLEQVTPRQNLERSPFFNGHKTHCKRGHSLDDCYVTKKGSRYCRHCINEANKKNRAVRSRKRQAWRIKNRLRDNATQRASAAKRRAKTCQLPPI